jgi:hypothetical protein
MKTKLLILLLMLASVTCFAATNRRGTGEMYGRTLNLGLGVGGYSGYYGYAGRSYPVLQLNYELDVAPYFTLAPFISLYSYRDTHYRETVIPFGLKGSYYLDKLLKSNSNWDFYLAGSLGLAVANSRWDNDYYGDRSYYHHANPIFLDLHIGTEYHVNKNIGVFFDLSTGVSTIGISIH